MPQFHSVTPLGDFFAKTRSRAFVFTPQPRTASSKNRLNYDGSASGVIIYTYVIGNPVNLFDPRGEFVVTAGRGLLLGLGMLATSAADNAFKGRLDSFIKACKSDDNNDYDKEREEARDYCTKLYNVTIQHNFTRKLTKPFQSIKSGNTPSNKSVSA